MGPGRTTHLAWRYKHMSQAKLSRRWVLQALPVMTLSGLMLPGCHPSSEPIRVGLHPWPGYELLHLAHSLGFLDTKQVRLVQTHSASASLRALATGSMEAACLTLDEMLTAREAGQDLLVVAVLNESVGADSLMVHPLISSLSDLEGKTIGVEHSAVGAVMLVSALQAAHLPLDAVQLRFVTVDQHESAILAGEVDAIVTYEPVKSRLLTYGLQEVFSSAEIPGRIIDVLAVKRSVAEKNPRAVRHLVKSHFAALQAFRDHSAVHLPFLAQRLGLEVHQVLDAYAELRLPDTEANRQMLSGPIPALKDNTEWLADVMVRNGLLQSVPELGGWITAEFLP